MEKHQGKEYKFKASEIYAYQVDPILKSYQLENLDILSFSYLVGFSQTLFLKSVSLPSEKNPARSYA